MTKKEKTQERKGSSAFNSKSRVQKKKVAEQQKVCQDKNCHIHGTLKVHGKVFQGKVIRKFSKRVTIEFERATYVRKYERFARHKTRIHARLPECMEDEIHIGEIIKIQECRPLSKIIHFVVIEKVEGGKNESN